MGDNVTYVHGSKGSKSIELVFIYTVTWLNLSQVNQLLKYHTDTYNIKEYKL